MGRAKIVMPYSGVHEVGARTPSLRLFMAPTEGAGNIITCKKTGAVWDIKDNDSTTAGVLLWDDDGAVRSGNDETINPSRITNVVMPTIVNDKAYLMMCSGRVSGTHLNRCSLGDINKLVSGSAGFGFGMSDGAYPGGEETFHCAVGYFNQQWKVSAGGGADLWNTAPDVDVCTWAKYTPNGGGQELLYKAQEIVSGTVRLDGGNTVINTNGGAVPFQIDPYFRFSGYALYGFALFEFSAFPSWIDTAIAWMAHQWRYAGRGKPRFIYPELIGYV